ncbi:hypothetical protein BH11PLA1_BH11PLA1_16370 [soil metagenome]
MAYEFVTPDGRFGALHAGGDWSYARVSRRGAVRYDAAALGIPTKSLPWWAGGRVDEDHEFYAVGWPVLVIEIGDTGPKLWMGGLVREGVVLVPPALALLVMLRWWVRWQRTMLIWRKRKHLRELERRSVKCLACGYDLAGLGRRNRCPECGQLRRVFPVSN